MNAVEIEAAVSELAAQPFDAAEFPFAFLAAFDNNETTITRLRRGNSNKSDVPGAVLQQNNIHLAVCEAGQVAATLDQLKASTKTKAAKAKFVLATDGEWLEAEDLNSGENIASPYPDLAQHFGFFLPLAGISTVKEIKDNPIDVRATGRLNRLYVELLKENPDWATEARRHDLNHFLARLIFCFFAEDTDIFMGHGIFTETVQQMSESNGSNTHLVLETIFRAMNLTSAEKNAANLPGWADGFPYVNGGLFSGATDTPHFTKIARTYLIRAGELNWREINPDIFGSMIQAVADDEERGALGMHYTSVPNILKVLNPLFLDELRAELEAAGQNKQALLNLRSRLARIRVFDPACGSGNFLVIAYKKMREIEAEINSRRGESHRATEIPATNFRGIEIRDFAAEIARLSLIIAQYQCDVSYRGPLEAKEAFLPLQKENWIVCGNALLLDWLSVCAPTGIGVSIKTTANDLFSTPLGQTKIDFQNEGGETYICGNPPYVGRKYQTQAQKLELKNVIAERSRDSLSLDYVSAWFVKAADFVSATDSESAFVCTNSICQGIQVSTLWPIILRNGVHISFAYKSIKWSNLASNNAGVTVSIIGLTRRREKNPRLFEISSEGVTIRECSNLNAYLLPGPNVFVVQLARPLGTKTSMQFGNHPYYANALMLESNQARELADVSQCSKRFIRPLYGSQELIADAPRSCIWITSGELEAAKRCQPVWDRVLAVERSRAAKPEDKQAKKLLSTPYRFRDQYEAQREVMIVPIVSSENRPYLPVGVKDSRSIVHNKAFALYDAPLWNMALIASRLHWVWIGTVCVRLEMRFSYSNTLGWNTFPVPMLTEQNKADLTRCAEDILLTREAHFPASIAELYDPENMPEDLRRAHDRNDEVLERIYIGRRFKNDTERLEKLFELYTKMTADRAAEPKAKRVKKDRAQTEELI